MSEADVHQHHAIASVEAVRAAGGTVVAEPYGFPGGRRFHFADPSGNELGIWSES